MLKYGEIVWNYLELPGIAWNCLEIVFKWLLMIENGWDVENIQRGRTGPSFGSA